MHSHSIDSLTARRRWFDTSLGMLLGNGNEPLTGFTKSLCDVSCTIHLT